jgi:Tfp pilus assembly protein PilV
MKPRGEGMRHESRTPLNRAFRRAVRSPSGLTLYEALVAITLLAVGLLALSAASASSVRRSSLSQTDMRQWAVVNRVTDSLFAAGWGNVSGGSHVAATFKMEWRVTTESADLERVDVVVGRLAAQGYGTATDTLTLYLSNPAP